VTDPFLSESHINQMIEKARALTCSAIEQFKPTAVIAAFSGGNDSIVSTHFACTEFDAMAVHCDTGIGIQKTKDHVWKVASKFNWAMVVRKAEAKGQQGTNTETLANGRWVNGETAYEEIVFNMGFPGPGQHGRAFQRLKQRQLKELGRQLAPNRGEKILIISGIRSDESAIRAGYRRDIQVEPGTKFIWVNPFYWNTSIDFEMYRQEFALPRNPVKDVIGISGECLCGAFASPGEKELIRQVEPETTDYIERLECKARELGFPWGWGQRPPQWWLDKKRGQGFLFPRDNDVPFQPMCVGCPRRAAKRTVKFSQDPNQKTMFNSEQEDISWDDMSGY
jgi:3'-phosphoadenosine 5'-phosphosulfate sulfotransferase (PAPS reductase)/FAD synthetase